MASNDTILYKLSILWFIQILYNNRRPLPLSVFPPAFSELPTELLFFPLEVQEVFSCCFERSDLQPASMVVIRLKDYISA